MRSEPCLTVRELRRRWKPTKERLGRLRPNHPTPIRLHRAFSWLQRCEEAGDGKDVDLVLLCHWIAFNALYGRWDELRREPLPDGESWREFLDAVLELDADGRIAAMLTAQRPLVTEILNDEYLSNFFWKAPSGARANQSKKARFESRTWYVEHKWGMVLERTLERVYVLRCQLTHGAATHGGKLNRQCLERCIQFLRHLLNAVLLVIIDHGGDADWGHLCYPPLNASAAGANGA